MRIAQVAPLYEAVPPGRYGGTERVIATLCDGLVRMGHDVTLFAPRTSGTAAALEAYGDPLRERLARDLLVNLAPHLHLKMLADLYARRDEFDVVHSHLDVWTLAFTQLFETPTILTMHGRLDLDFLRDLLPRYASVPLVSVSDDQRSAVADLDLTWAGTVYNGLDLAAYDGVERDPAGYLAFVGRIAEEKGPVMAIEVARRCRLPLRVAAKVDALDQAYYEEQVAPVLGPDIDFVGEIDERQKPGFYAGARAMLFPIDWPEPFGLVMIESMAAGTPVIAFRRGSVPEVVEDGVTGFLCDDVDQMVEAVARLGEIDPDACRRRAGRFSGGAMCRGYLEVYENVVARAGTTGLRAVESPADHGRAGGATSNRNPQLLPADDGTSETARRPRPICEVHP